jgi:hypothetical protein
MSDLYIKDTLTVAQYLITKLSAKGARIITSAVYDALKDSLQPMDEVSFKMAFSKAIHDNTLAGFTVKKGRFGGIFLTDMAVAKDTVAKLEAGCVNAAPPEAPTEKTRKPRAPKAETNSDNSAEADPEDAIDVDGMKSDCLTIRLTQTLRISPDKYNWCLQKLVGTDDSGEETWQGTAYWSTLDQALNGVARKILDKKLKLSATVVSDLNLVAGIVRDCQREIMEEIKKNIDVKYNKSE